MDFGVIHLDEAERRFWDEEVTTFYDEMLTPGVFDRERADGSGLIPELERELARRGWSATVDMGPEGRPPVDTVRLAIVGAEERGRVGTALPVKGSHAVVVSVLRSFASDELRRSVFPGIARGEVTCCLGYTEPDCGSDAAAIRTRAVRDGDEWVLTGQKMFSTGANLAEYVMMTARTNGDVPKHRGITMFLVPTDSAGLETQGIETLGGERTNFVYLDEVRIADSHRLGPIDQGWEVATGALAAEHGMDADHGALDVSADDTELVAALEGIGGWTNEIFTLHDAALDWARTTVDANGRPRIDDPLVRARLAELALECEVKLATPNPYVRIFASESLIRAAEDVLDLVGTPGLVARDATGAVADGAFEWVHRFAQGTAIYGGTTDIQRNLIAEQYLGLPRHRGALRR